MNWAYWFLISLAMIIFLLLVVLPCWAYWLLGAEVRRKKARADAVRLELQALQALTDEDKLWLYKTGGWRPK